MTEGSRNLALLRPSLCPLSTDDLLDFRPRQILYREMFVPRDAVNARYVRIDKPSRFRPDLFEEIIERAARYDYFRNSPDREEYHWLDIPVYRASIIILQISERSRWKFPDIPIAFESSGGVCPDHLYGGLRFVDERGQAYPQWFDGCKLIYFCARSKRGSQGRPYRQAMTYYGDPGFVRLFDIDPETQAEIDPDIRHPGNGGETTEP